MVKRSGNWKIDKNAIRLQKKAHSLVRSWHRMLRGGNVYEIFNCFTLAGVERVSGIFREGRQIASIRNEAIKTQKTRLKLKFMVRKLLRLCFRAQMVSMVLQINQLKARLLVKIIRCEPGSLSSFQLNASTSKIGDFTFLLHVRLATSRTALVSCHIRFNRSCTCGASSESVKTTKASTFMIRRRRNLLPELTDPLSLFDKSVTNLIPISTRPADTFPWSPSYVKQKFRRPSLIGGKSEI